MTHPHFIVIGAMKCGTTTLADQLAAQAGVFVTTPKEPNYFSDDDVFAKGPEWYAQLFAPANPGDIRAEASTHYTKLPTYPDTVARMKAALPDLKLVYMIRNPVDRAVSHYIHEWSERRMGGDIGTAVKDHVELVEYGRYAHQLYPFLKAYGVEAVFLTSLEQIKAEPTLEFARISAFLGLPDGCAWQDSLGASNVSAARIRTFPLQGVLIDNPVMKTLRGLLFPKSFRTWVRSQLTMKKRPELSDDARAMLEARFLQDREELARIFPDHPALDLCYPFARS